MKNQPSKLSELLIKWIIREDLQEEVLGDLYEYYDQLSYLNEFKKAIFFWFHLSQFLRPSLIKNIFNSANIQYISMLTLHLKLTFRSIKKYRSIGLTSLFTLILGAIATLTVLQWVENEIRTDQFHANIDRLYLTSVKTNAEADLTSISLSTMFQLDYDQFPEVLKTAQVHVYGERDTKVATANRTHWGQALVVDSSFFDLFSFDIKDGQQSDLLSDPISIIITEEFAQQLFGDENPIGQPVDISCDQQGTYIVSSVLQNLPSSSSIQFDLLIPRHSKPFWRRIPQEILLTQSDFDLENFNAKIKTLGRANNTRFPESELSIFPLSEVYFNDSFTSSLFVKMGNKTTVNILLATGMLLMIITWMGFSNLQNSQLVTQTHTLGIQHAIGGTKRNFHYQQFVSRSVYWLIGTVIAFISFEFIQSFIYRQFDMRVDHSPLRDFLILSTITAIISYSSLILTIIHIQSLKLKTVFQHKRKTPRLPRIQHALSVSQYAVTIALLIASLIIFSQLRFMSDAELGIRYTDVVQVDFFEMLGRNASEEQRQKAQQNYEYILNELSISPLVAGSSQGNLPVSMTANKTSWKKANSDVAYTTQNMMIVDPDYQNVLGLNLVQGRWFDADIDENNQQKVIVNEAAIKFWNIDNIQAERLKSNTSGRREFEFEIIGVVSDYHYEHLSQKIQPLVLRYRPYQDDSFLIRFSPGNHQAGLRYLEELFFKVNPKGIFQFTFLKNEIARQYDNEKNLTLICISFTIIALILSCIYLFAFSYHETERRTKEVGIRKTLGASTAEILNLLSLNSLKIVGLASLIALPSAYYFEQWWLGDFANQVTIGWWVYAVGGIFTMIISLGVAGFQSIRVAQKNPVDSLRYE
ncbi:MAG: ABC transporter permease [Cyclobacteriaceae bacterium]